MTTLRLRPYDAATRGAVTLFTWPDCVAVSGRLYADENPSRDAQYTKDEMWENNIHWDDADSVYVPFGYKLTLYDSDGFSGDSEEIHGIAYSDDREEMTCQNLSNMKNRAASAIVSHTIPFGPAVGWWESSTHSETITVKY